MSVRVTSVKPRPRSGSLTRGSSYSIFQSSGESDKKERKVRGETGLVTRNGHSCERGASKGGEDWSQGSKGWLEGNTTR